MAFFSTAQASGRPLAVAPQTFAAILFGRLHGYSRKRAEEILAANPEAASGTIWRLAAVGQSEGCQTAEQFERWVQRELSEAMTAPSIP